MIARGSRSLALGAVILILALGIAGCLGPATQTGTPEPDESTTPEPNESAERRALAAEQAYLEAQLRNASCVESWGTNATVGIEEEATTVNRTKDGLYVEVTHPYWYGTDRVEADSGSTALYLVTPETVERVRGDDVSPCSD